MGVYCWTVQLTKLILNYLCHYVVPIVETVAHKLRVVDCVCESPPHSAKRRVKGKKPRRTPARELEEELNPSEHGSEMKRIKLLLDITVDKSNSQVVACQATPQSDNCTRQVRSSGFIVRLLNIPSSILLYITSKIRQWNWSQEMASLEVTHCCEMNRIKKSPKRRISKANYRKIIPFFPFNLLGFSNYSAFQMPTLTCSKECSAECTAAEETNNLNASSGSAHGNGKSRCKRRRDSSTCDELLSLSSNIDNDFTHLEMPESQNFAVTENGKEELRRQDGHDEVDSDEIPDIESTQAAPSISLSDSIVKLEKQSPSKNNGTMEEVESDEIPDIEDDQASSSTSYLSDLNEKLEKQSPSKNNGTAEEVESDEIPDNESEEAAPSTPLSDFNETPEKSPSKNKVTVDEVDSDELSDIESEEAAPSTSDFETPEKQSPSSKNNCTFFNAEEGQNDEMNGADKAKPKPRYRV